MGDEQYVLVVDDDLDFASTLADVLEIAGFTVSTASNGLDAIQKVKEEAFDCILMDIKMAGIDGAEACIEIKKYRPATKVILMTGYVSDEVSQKGLDGGASAILYKPFNYKELVQAMKDQCK